MLNYTCFINNQFINANSDNDLVVISPADEQIVAKIINASNEDVNFALSAADEAQKKWKKLTSIERGQYLNLLADKIIERAPIIGSVLALESGKSLEDATNEAIYAAEVTRYHAGWARRIEGEIIPSDTPNENLMLFREPIGIAACLIPFNYPVYTLLRKIAPALITGNTVIVRPSNNTPCSALEVAKAVQESGIPDGVINILVMSHDVAAQVCTDSKVGIITLTGSVGAGRQILEYSKTNIAKSSLELGGKTPAIVEADADLEKAAQLIVMSKTTNCGQLCTSVERVYVHESIHDKFVALLKTQMEQKKFGNRALDSQLMGPQISKKARDNLHAMVERAVSEGATIVSGAYIPQQAGFYYPPTLLINCTQDMEIIQEELFGPVLPVVKYKSVDEALTMANDHQYGLASVLFSENYRTIMQFSNNIEAGELYINRTPADPYQGFHAGWKRSGLGGDDGKHGMLEFTQTRLVIMNY